MKYRDIEQMDKAQKLEKIKKLKKDLVSLKIMGDNDSHAISARLMRKDIARILTSLNK